MFSISGGHFCGKRLPPFLIPFNFDFFYITIPLTFICNDHANLLPGFDAGIKKSPQRSRLEFLRA
jgi:hypothetical protein